MVHAGNTGLQKTKIKNTDTLQKLNTIQKKETTQNTAKQNYTLVQSPFTTLGQETGWAYSTTFQSPHGALCSR